MASKKVVKEFLQLRQQFWGNLSPIYYLYEFVRVRLFYTTQTVADANKGISKLINRYGSSQNIIRNQE